MMTALHHLPRRRLLLLRPRCLQPPASPVSAPPPPARSLSTAHSPAPSSSRWLSDIKARLGQCIMFGLDGVETVQAARIAATLASEWRGLTAGADGFCVDDDGDGGEGPQGRGASRAWVEAVRWGDMDSMVSHVNNAAYLRYAEISRIHYFRRLLARHVPAARRRAWTELWTPRAIGLILKRADVEFLFPASFPDHLTLVHRIAGPLPPAGDAVAGISMRCAVLSHAHQRAAARVAEDDAVYDYRAGRRAALEPWMAAVLRAAAAEEEASARFWTRRRADVQAEVDALAGATVASGRAEDVGR